MEKRKIIILVLLALAVNLSAKIKLPAIVSSNMVLQRNTTVKLWGWADANEKITVELSWLDKSLNVTTDKNGKWSISVNTTNSKEPQSIRLKSKESDITLENILFGEVWLCSGQSNMYQPLEGYKGQPVYGYLETVVRANNSNLRLFTVNNVGSKTPLPDVKKYIAWQEASPANVPAFSAVAYYFGKQLQEILDVPVGLIHSSWGGSNVQAWISKEVLNKFENVNIDSVDISYKTNRISTALFNAMINPLIPYTIKGVLWYQGEANRKEPEKYKKLFPAMVKDWRTRWDIGNFPFLYVQIAPYFYGGRDLHKIYNDPYYNSAFIREVQQQCVELIPNSAMAVTLDIGKEYCIHPPQKKEVADRLLYKALNKVYGFSAVECDAPVFKSLEAKDGGLVVKFDNIKRGLFSYTELTGFEIAGKDHVFYPAKAKIINRHLELFVESKKVTNPVAVRYAWRNYIKGTLFGGNLLPVSSFRTDNWDDAVLYKK